MSPAYCPATERFWDKVEQQGDCWVWTASTGGKGYGSFRGEGRVMWIAHRWAYEHMVGPIPEGLYLDHLCRNPLCVNPYHLDPVTNRVNMMRGVGWPATRARQTECTHGHPLSGENLRVRENGTRQCIACCRRRDREKNQRARAARKARRELRESAAA